MSDRLVNGNVWQHRSVPLTRSLTERRASQSYTSLNAKLNPRQRYRPRMCKHEAMYILSPSYKGESRIRGRSDARAGVFHSYLRRLLAVKRRSNSESCRRRAERAIEKERRRETAGDATRRKRRDIGDMCP